jgi:hypothetical protein
MPRLFRYWGAFSRRIRRITPSELVKNRKLEKGVNFFRSPMSISPALERRASAMARLLQTSLLLTSIAFTTAALISAGLAELVSKAERR